LPIQLAAVVQMLDDMTPTRTHLAAWVKEHSALVMTMVSVRDQVIHYLLQEKKREYLCKTSRSDKQLCCLQTQHTLQLPSILNKEMCSWLLRNFSDITRTAEPLRYPHAAVHLAALPDGYDIHERLLSLVYDPDIRIRDWRQTLLHVSACQGPEPASAALLNAKVDIKALDI
jgi:hypothetical protein